MFQIVLAVRFRILPYVAIDMNLRSGISLHIFHGDASPLLKGAAEGSIDECLIKETQ